MGPRVVDDEDGGLEPDRVDVAEVRRARLDRVQSGFRDRFIAKGRFERRMDEMPVKLITHPQPGQFGAAAAFAKEYA